MGALRGLRKPTRELYFKILESHGIGGVHGIGGPPVMADSTLPRLMAKGIMEIRLRLSAEKAAQEIRKLIAELSETMMWSAWVDVEVNRALQERGAELLPTWGAGELKRRAGAPGEITQAAPAEGKRSK